MSNPYDGTPQADDWIKGFNDGLVAPDQPIEAPSVLSPDSLDAYNNGVQIGQYANSQLTPVEQVESTLATILDWVHVGMDVGGPLQVAAVKAFAGGSSIWQVVRAAGLEIGFNLAVLVAIWGPTRDDIWPEAVAARLRALQSAISTGNGTDANLELFMAVAEPTNTPAELRDPLGPDGIWHGPFRLTFNEASADAKAYAGQTRAYVHRYQSSQPTLSESLNP